MKTPRRILAERLRDAMDATLDMQTQMGLSRKSGVTQSTIQRILAEQVSCTLDQIFMLAGALRVSPGALISDDPNELVLSKKWGRLSVGDQARLLAIMDVMAGITDDGPRLDFERSHPIPPQHRVQAQRAAARKPQPDHEFHPQERLTRPRKRS